MTSSVPTLLIVTAAVATLAAVAMFLVVFRSVRREGRDQQRQGRGGDDPPRPSSD